MTLPMSQLPSRIRGRVQHVGMDGPMRRRLLDLGLVPGTDVERIMSSPTGDPVCYRVRGAMIALRDDDARRVTVEIDD